MDGSPEIKKPEIVEKAENWLNALKKKNPEMDHALEKSKEERNELKDSMNLMKVVDRYVGGLPEDLKELGYNEEQIKEIIDGIKKAGEQKVEKIRADREAGVVADLEGEAESMLAEILNPENFAHDVDERIESMKESPFKMKLIAFGMGWAIPYIDKFTGAVKKKKKEEAPKSDADDQATEVADFNPEILEGKTIYELANWQDEAEKPAILAHLKAKFESIAGGLERVTPASASADGIQKPAVLHFANDNDFEVTEQYVGLAGDGGEMAYSDFDDLKSIIESTGSIDV